MVDEIYLTNAPKRFDHSCLVHLILSKSSSHQSEEKWEKSLKIEQLLKFCRSGDLKKDVLTLFL